MGYSLGIDLGTTYTAAAVSDGQHAEIVPLGDRSPQAPSVVYRAPDGSFRYGVNDNFEVSLDVSNILNTTAVTQQQVFGDSTLTPGATPVKLDSGWVRNDRRFQLGVRFKY